jgi:hypothetical protein
MLPDGELTVLMTVTALVNLFAKASLNSDFARTLDDERQLHSDQEMVVGVYRKELKFFINALVGGEPDREVIRVDASLINARRSKTS